MMADETNLTFTSRVVPVIQQKKAGKRWSWTPQLENGFCYERAYSYLLRYAIG
jgi:hypothetical protein